MNKYAGSRPISKVEITNDTLTGRGGLTPFVRYLSQINIYPILVGSFGHIRKSKKGVAIWNIFKQIFCFFFDGTSRHLTYFDAIKKDEGYAGAIENTSEEMLSSHAVKRFFGVFGWWHGSIYRKILNRLFIWRLRLEKPDEVAITIDTMVMDNDEAPKRHGVGVTYKKKKGFQPLQMIWSGRIVDAVFRGGKKHGNSGDTAINMITRMVELIRREYRRDITIIIQMDSGFFDQDIFSRIDNLNVIFVATGKIYNWVKERVLEPAKEDWKEYDNGHQAWKWVEIKYKCNSWEEEYRGFYTHPVIEGDQHLFDFARPDTVIITNLGRNDKILQNCTRERQQYWLSPENIIHSHHMRGADELPHRGLKDFGFEQMPFKRFGPNTAFYYCMVIGFFLFESYKQDVLKDIIPLTAYATTVRRRAVDFAAKVIRRGGQNILKVTQAVMDGLKMDMLWLRCQSPPPICL